ncbi:MAG: hypothetical protein Q9168_008420, partial [Polycauliona sp. 1 TL-2023]
DPNNPNPNNPNDPNDPESSSTSSCTKSSVTNFFVSCTGSDSAGCTTTSSRVVAGCDVTAVATTTRDSCPLITLDPNEDQGEDGDANAEPPASTTQPPPSATQPPPDPTDPPPAPPAPTVTIVPVYIFIGFFETCDNCEDANFLGIDKHLFTRWAIFSANQIAGTNKIPIYDPWNDTPNLEDPLPIEGTQYPVKKGPLTSTSYTGEKSTCYYTRKHDDERPDEPSDPGQFTCDDKEWVCTDDQKGRSKHKDKDGKDEGDATWSPQAVCVENRINVPTADDLKHHPDPLP